MKEIENVIEENTPNPSQYDIEILIINLNLTSKLPNKVIICSSQFDFVYFDSPPPSQIDIDLRLR